MTKWKYLANRKRAICLLSIVAAGVILGYVYFISWFVGFVLTKLGAGKAAGERGRVRSIYIPLGNRRIHLHHWLIAILLMPVPFIASIPFVPSVVIMGFLSGIVFQGIYNYGDWYRIVKPRCQQAISGAAAVVAEIELCQGPSQADLEIVIDAK